MHVIVYATPTREGLNPITKPTCLVKDLRSPPPKEVESPTIGTSRIKDSIVEIARGKSTLEGILRHRSGSSHDINFYQALLS